MKSDLVKRADVEAAIRDYFKAQLDAIPNSGRTNSVILVIDTILEYNCGLQAKIEAIPGQSKEGLINDYISRSRRDYR